MKSISFTLLDIDNPLFFQHIDHEINYFLLIHVGSIHYGSRHIVFLHYPNHLLVSFGNIRHLLQIAVVHISLEKTFCNHLRRRIDDECVIWMAYRPIYGIKDEIALIRTAPAIVRENVPVCDYVLVLELLIEENVPQSVKPAGEDLIGVGIDLIPDTDVIVCRFPFIEQIMKRFLHNLKIKSVGQTCCRRGFSDAVYPFNGNVYVITP